MTKSKSKSKKSTRYQLQKKLEQIRKLQDENKTNRQISDTIDIPLRTVEYYSNKIFEQDKKRWEMIETESLENRALLIKRKYQELADICDKILHDEKRSPKDRIDAGKIGISCENNIYAMIKDGPLRLNNITITGKDMEDKSQ